MVLSVIPYHLTKESFLVKVDCMDLVNPYGKVISLPVGNLLVVATTDALVGLKWEHLYASDRTLYRSNALIEDTDRQLREYFAGKRTRFDLPFFFEGTSLQKAVWKALQNIPYGSTISYASLAQNVENATAVRAVASAVGKNPFPILIPCHRVIGSDGKLRGFAGGLSNKQILLDIETSKSHQKQ